VRKVLALAIVLLALVLAAELGVDRLGGPVRSGADRALEVLVGARGRLLPFARLGPGREWIGAEVRLGDRTLRAPEGLDGLFAVRLDLLGGGTRIDACSGPEGADALRAALANLHGPTLLTLSSQGDLSALRVDAINEVLVELGARARVGTSTPESLAVVALWFDERWSTLAEAWSPDSGVAAAFVLGPDLAAHARRSGDAVVVQDPREAVDFLVDELPWAEAGAASVAERAEVTVAGRTMPALRQRANTTLAWSDVAIGAGSGFLAWLGVEEGASGPLEFQLRVEGELLVRRVVAPGAPWRTELVDLRAYQGRRARIELAVTIPDGAPMTGSAAWGRPMLVQGFERSPLTAWAEAR
jgi:hypothetical protein